MDCKDLMIGDWVVLKSNGVQPDTKIRITELSADGGFVDDCDNFIGYEELDPIPLTEEILVKNGFASSEGYAYLNLDENNFLEFCYYSHRLSKIYMGIEIDEWNKRVNIRDVVFVSNCNYVHEFQHDLKRCGIDKEIEL